MSANAIILAGKSTNPDFDIAQLQADVDSEGERVQRPARFQAEPATGRATCAVLTTRAPTSQPEGVTGRIFDIEAESANAVFTLQGVLGTSTINELKVGYNAADTNIAGIGADGGADERAPST